MKSQVYYKKSLPSLRDIGRLTKGRNFILIFDERLLAFIEFKLWANQFHNKYPVAAGEGLKSIDAFSAHVKKILPMLSGFSPKENIIVSVGGGSVGDFAGFVASVLKRGVGYVHIPSTWLAAVDSAHGGKTALNVGDLKNQIGTFYSAQIIFCVQEILDQQSVENVRSGYGELIKIALIAGGSLYQQMIKMKVFDAKNLWRLLPKAVEAKHAVVKRDPLEITGVRHLLNLGHTLGHAIELEKGLPHGQAVQLGLEFATDWSYRRKILNQKDYDGMRTLYTKNKINHEILLQKSRLHLRLKQDKKALSGDRVRFAFLKKPGRVLIEPVLVDEVVAAACELGWAK
ncbi:MAG: 3-dehydroquinate synthase [Bdellovibrionales bacterium]|nr:3-dehydroquinate synthase [Bdellovibrionales bacterium]